MIFDVEVLDGYIGNLISEERRLTFATLVTELNKKTILGPRLSPLCHWKGCKKSEHPKKDFS